MMFSPSTSLRAVLLGTVALATASSGALTTATASVPETATSAVAAAPDTGRRLDVLRMRRGPDARIDHLQDSVIRTASGTRVRVRLRGADRHLALLGRSGNRWLVISGRRAGSQFPVSAIRRGHAPVTMPGLGGYAANGDVYSGWMLSRDGDLVVRTILDRGGETAEARSVDGGKLVDDLYDAEQPLDMADGRVVLRASDDDGRTGVLDWRPGQEATTLLTRRAAGASIAHGLLWVRTAGISYGPTSLDAPGTPAWSAPFQPLDHSPSGELVAGLRLHRDPYDDPAVLEVRRVADGTLVDSISFGPRITRRNYAKVDGHEQTVRWESDKHLVLEMRTRRGSVLVRCRPGGRCERAGDYGGAVSVAREIFTWPLPE